MPAKTTKELMKFKLDETVDQITKIIERLQQLHLRDDGKKFQLGDLPSEILYMIGKSMPMESTLSLSATCKDFQKILNPITKKAKERSRAKFRRLQERDELALCIEHERTSNHDDPLRACGGCSMLHHANSFTNPQLLVSPKLRTCRGRARRFSPCEHTAYTWGTVARMPLSDNQQLDDDRVKNDRFHCQECSDEGSDGSFSKSRTARQTNQSPTSTSNGTLENKTVQFTKYRYLTRLSAGWIVEGLLVAEKLREWPRQVCPHMVTTMDTFPRLIGLKFRLADEKKDKEISDELRDIISRRASAYCSHPGCNTKLFIDVTGNKISLGITRDLGVMNAPDESEWMVQSVVAPTESEESWRERLYRGGWWAWGSPDVGNSEEEYSVEEYSVEEYSEEEYSEEEYNEEEYSA